MKYYNRYLEKIIERKLKSSGAILVSGPKFCGKTTTCSMFSKSIYRINTRSLVYATRFNPKMALIGETPHLIDEWQKVPDIWNYIKEDLDIEYSFGKYILTGSSTPADKKYIQHSGAGRIVPLKMRTMSLFESLESKGKVSLKELFNDSNKEYFDPNTDFTINDTAFLICRGGWPLSINDDKEVSLDITKNYYDGLFTFEDSDNERFRNKKPEILKMILRSYARNISTEASLKTMINDVKQSNERTMDEKTFNDYSEALKDIYIIEDMEAWCPNIRSKTTIVSTPTRHFADTSIACQALGIYPDDLLKDFNSFGFFFEDFVIRDLRIYAELLGGTIKHYRDGAGLECDAVIHLDNGQWAAIEIKLGGEDLIEYGAKRLNLLKSKIEMKSEISKPTFMMIITGCGPLYKRKEDGIYVVPINMLKD
ncbi:MAG TPA: AAA family ATPase [Firmicutes bacterium]|nr:AAA family ATPase [Bacillota bacterium]